MRIGLVILVLAGMVTGPVTPASPEPAPAGLMVVVKGSSPVRTLTMAQLRQLFGTGRLRAPDGLRLVPINLAPGHKARVRFDRRVLSLEPGDVGRYWVNRKIRGQSGPPRAYAQRRVVLQLAASLPQVVAYVPAGPLPPGVRVVPIDGAPPGQPSYPLGGAP